MMFILKALISTAFIATLACLFFESFIAVLALSFHLPSLVFWTAEGLGLMLALFLSGLFFIRAYKYERFGDARKPAFATS